MTPDPIENEIKLLKGNRREEWCSFEESGRAALMDGKRHHREALVNRS